MQTISVHWDTIMQQLTSGWLWYSCEGGKVKSWSLTDLMTPSTLFLPVVLSVEQAEELLHWTEIWPTTNIYQLPLSKKCFPIPIKCMFRSNVGGFKSTFEQIFHSQTMHWIETFCIGPHKSTSWALNQTCTK